MSVPREKGRRPKLQVCALCWRSTPRGLRVLIVTSLDTGRWIMPKGWMMPDLSAAETAACEAWEEAGIHGRLDIRPIGKFRYLKTRRKSSRKVKVVVFAIAVTGIDRHYPERGRRRRAWLSPDEAARRLSDPGLGALLAKLPAILPATC